MAIYTGQLTVGTTAITLDGGSSDPVRIHVHNNDNTNNLYLGNESVTSSTGLALPKLDSVEMILNPGEILYAVAGSGTIAVSWLKQVY